MTSDPSHKTGDSSEGKRTNREPRAASGGGAQTNSTEAHERLVAENQALRERVDDLEATLGDVRDELAELKSAHRTDDGGEEPSEASGVVDATRELVTQGGSPTKVIGRLSDDGGIGVLGEATGTGDTVGVQGMVDSANGDGLYTPDDARIEGETAIGTASPVTTLHVKDSVAESGDDNLGRHVAAVQNTSTSGDPIPDVLGLELGNISVPGEFHSYISFMDQTGTIGNIQGNGNGGVEFNGTLPHLDTTNSGLLAQLSSNQTVQDATNTVVKFTNSKKDDFGGLDTSNGKYTVQVAGDYHVTTAVRWLDRLPGATSHKIGIYLKEAGGTEEEVAERSREVPGGSGEEAYIHEHLSKTLYDLSQGDVIWVEVRHQFGDSSEELTDTSSSTYLTIDKVG